MFSVMNSLNIVSRLTTTPPRSRAGSIPHVDAGSGSAEDGESAPPFDVASLDERLNMKAEAEEDWKYLKQERHGEGEPTVKVEDEAEVHEKTPLLSGTDSPALLDAPGGRASSMPKRMAQAVLRGLQVVISTIAAPCRYVIACFYDEQGHFSAILPLRNFRTLFSRRRRKSTAQAIGLSSAPDSDEEFQRRTSSRRSASVGSNASSNTMASSDGEPENEDREDSPARHTRSRTAAAAAQQDDSNTSPLQKRSIKIQTQPDEALRKRRAAKALQRSKGSASPDDVAAVASALKSPSSPQTTSTFSTKMTRYPRAPAPPRPLVPRRQPSYTLSYSPDAPKKTLIIDLDETLIHSMAKGGRMSTGHMVEVRLGGPVPTAQPGTTGATPLTPPIIGPGVPILYYVHERPGCHEFLRKISKWYNLVVFTASVQEYADPVIDWLEREKRYFGGRYYRQHCTLRNGAYIKDLAQVEPDLSRVMILDNSPMSYIFHEDNAIPIEGWISDPTDNDLLHLIPLLEGLQYVTDVRALLALRQGQAQQA